VDQPNDAPAEPRATRRGHARRAKPHDAELISNSQLREVLAGQPPDVKAEIVRINTDARPGALQVALLVPLLAALLGLVTPFRMVRSPEPGPSSSAESMVLG